MATSRAPLVAGGVSVVVVGGGVIGLSTALQLLRSGFTRVVVMADAWTPNTTSDGAGAFWERHYDGHAKWARVTMQHYTSLVAAGRGVETGVGFIDGYQFSHDEDDGTGTGAKAYPFQVDVPAFRMATAGEVSSAAARTGQSLRSGCFWRSVIADSPTYLMWLMREVTAAGGALVRRQVTSLAELAPYFDIVVNCAGLGARELVGDGTMVGIRGQLIRVYAPQVTRFYTHSAGPSSEWHGAYVLPRPTSGIVTLGGTFERGREEVASDARDCAMIWDMCCKLCPQLMDPRTIRIDEWAGLRPGRKADVRLELEQATLGGRRIAIVHNYGHAGCGHSLHWGCAVDAAALACSARDAIVGGTWAGYTPPTPALPLSKWGTPPIILEGPHTVIPRIMGHVPRVLPSEEEGVTRGMGMPGVGGAGWSSALISVTTPAAVASGAAAWLARARL